MTRVNPLDLLACAFLTTLAGAAQRSGRRGRRNVTLDGTRWVVADAIARRDGDDIAVVFGSMRFDRKSIAADGRIDVFDFMGLGGPTLTIRMEDDRPANCFDFRPGSGGGSACDRDDRQAVVVGRNAYGRIAGAIEWSKGSDTAIGADFDLPVVTRAERPGTPLPVDGGEPGKAMLAHFAALATGNLSKIRAVSHPDRVAMLDEAEASDAREMIDAMRATPPTGVSATGGVVDDDTALVDFDSTREGQAFSGTAELVRVEGRRYVIGTSTRN